MGRNSSGGGGGRVQVRGNFHILTSKKQKPLRPPNPPPLDPPLHTKVYLPRNLRYNGGGQHGYSNMSHTKVYLPRNLRYNGGQHGYSNMSHTKVYLPRNLRYNGGGQHGYSNMSHTKVYLPRNLRYNGGGQHGRPVARIFFWGVRSLERKGYFCQRFSVAVKSIYNQLRHDNSLLL